MDNQVIELIIRFQDHQEVALDLTQDGQLLDTLAFPLDIHFDTVLVTSIDKILKKNRIERSSLKIVKVAGSIGESSVAYRIAQTVKAALETR